MYLLRPERFVFSIIAALFFIDASLVLLRGISVDIVGYSSSIAIGSSLIVLAQLYRKTKRNNNIAAALTAAGLFILFSISGSIFNYMFLPVRFPLIDETLMRVDSWLGYDWASAVTWAATYPLVGKVLFAVYTTSLPQILLIVLALGFMGKIQQLHQFLVTGVLGALASIVFWVFFPSYSPSAYQHLPEWVLHEIPLALGPEYGRELIILGRDGAKYLTPTNVQGLIGFPSFHIFMAAISAYFVPRHWPLVFLTVVLNLLMVPAALIQGAHHLTDVFGGIILFAIVCPISIRLVNHRTLRAANAPHVNLAFVPHESRQ